MFHNNVNNQKDNVILSAPLACEEEIFKIGHTVFVFSQCQWKSEKIEEGVKKIGERSGVKKTFVC